MPLPQGQTNRGGTRRMRDVLVRGKANAAEN